MEKLIEVKVDKRTELMGIMLLLSNYSQENDFLIEECNNAEYREKILSFFQPYKDEKAIKLLNKIIDELCFNYDAPFYLILQLDENFSFSNLPDYPFKERLCSSSLVIDFLKEVPKFVNKTKYLDFYNSCLSFYDDGIKQIQNLIKDFNIVGFLKNFYKYDFKGINFTINLMHIATNSNYGTQNDNSFYCNCCLRKSDDGKINFIDSIHNTLTLYVHEFSHSVINPLTREFLPLLENTVADLLSEMKIPSYNNVETIINEHIIRSLEVVYLKNENKIPNHIECAKNYRDDCFEDGFIYIDHCIQSLENYINMIDQYSNFKEYFPQVLKVFKKQGL